MINPACYSRFTKLPDLRLELKQKLRGDSCALRTCRTSSLDQYESKHGWWIVAVVEDEIARLQSVHCQVVSPAVKTKNMFCKALVLKGTARVSRP